MQRSVENNYLLSRFNLLIMHTIINLLYSKKTNDFTGGFIMPSTIGQTIKKLRKERNLTQEELAEQLNVTYQAVSKWENETGLPDISQIVPLASVFGVSTDVLFGTVGKSDKEEVREILDSVCRLNEENNTPYLCKNKDSYSKLQEGLRKYPNNMWLLMHCLEVGIALAYPKDDQFENDIYDEAHGQEIYQECIRMANIITSYSKGPNDILRAHMIMVYLHSAYGNFEKAREHAENFPCRSDFTVNNMHAVISHFEKNHAASAKYSRADTNFHLESLAYAMMQLADAYKHMQRNDYALDVYNRVKQLLELFPDDEHFSTPNVWTEWGQLDELIAKLQ